MKRLLCTCASEPTEIIKVIFSAGLVIIAPDIPARNNWSNEGSTTTYLFFAKHSFQPDLFLFTFESTMDKPKYSQKPAPTSEQTKQTMTATTSDARTSYLIFYNSVSAILWLAIFGENMIHLFSQKPYGVYSDIGQFVKWIQTIAGLEVVHSLIGVAPPTRRTQDANHKC